MFLKRFSAVSVLAAMALMAACGGSPETANNSAASNSNTAANGGNTITSTGSGNSPTAVQTPEPTKVVNDARTLGPVYKAYCTALAAKDDAALKKVLAAETLEKIEADMKDDPSLKSLWSYFEEQPKPADTCSARNERINGNVGEVEVFGQSFPTQGGTIVMVKEGEEWKITTRIAAFDKK